MSTAIEIALPRDGEGPAAPLLVPEPTAQFAERLQHLRASAGPSPVPIPTPIPQPLPIPLPIFRGARFLIWKQDPTVGTLGARVVYLPGLILNGPRNARVTTHLAGSTPVARNSNGDFIFPVNSPEMDCAHTFAIVQSTLALFTRLRAGTPIPWAWNSASNTDPITVHPRAGVTPNAYYSRNERVLKFFYFTPSGSSTTVFTCRSFDIAAHETGHAILDGLKPGWLGIGNPPQTGGLHESFGDLCAIFLALSQLDQVEAVVALTKANLHDKNFLAALAEQFGSALGMPIGLRNADNDLKLSQVGNQVHSISQVFTGGIYDVLADIFAYERNRQLATKDAAHVLFEVGQHLAKLLLEAIVASPAVGATYSDVVNKMLQTSHAQGDPPIYRTFIRNRFTFREVVVSATPLTAFLEGTMDMTDAKFGSGDDVKQMKAWEHPADHSAQDRSYCCGTMTAPENMAAGKPDSRQVDEEALLADEMQDLKRLFVTNGSKAKSRS